MSSLRQFLRASPALRSAARSLQLDTERLWCIGCLQGEKMAASLHTAIYPHAPEGRPRPRFNNSGTSGNIGVMTKLREEGWFDEAIEIVDKMDKQGMEITSNVLLCLLSEAIKRNDLKQGRVLHGFTKKHNLESDTFLGTFLIRFYTSCGFLEEAIAAFNKVTDMSVYTWSDMIKAHARLGKGEDGLKVFDQMLQQSDLKPEENVFVAALEACAVIPSIDEGRRIHKCIMEHALTANANIGCALIDMYTRCGDFDEARKVFERLPKRELVVWNSMIAAYSHFKRFPEAFRLVQVLQQERLKPNDVTFVTMLKTCTGSMDLEAAKMIHSHISENQFDTNLVVASALINMYSRCGSMEGVSSVFQRLRIRDGRVWSAMVSGFTELGHAEDAIQQLLPRIPHESVMLTEAFMPLVKACCCTSSLEEAKRIHARALGGEKQDQQTGTTLADMYCKAGRLKDARRLLEKWYVKPPDMWNTVISGYAKQRLSQDAFTLLEQMRQEGFKPSVETVVCMLEACSSSADRGLAEQIHMQIIDCGLQANPLVGKAVAEMFDRCGRLEDAQQGSQVMSSM
ncbi:hypothetical protein GOP47_0016412 [Adiantum capillus-veneris]|uniref:Pentatricopeptide repeat-containing protein n=1 Tax=Adiantum capillus-veneris TaxID=13818 RepID=A0A9D4UI32_ADICA|nr:hypothetical protein GOP47_0016412 [Adiantum capillus-veneris]